MAHSVSAIRGDAADTYRDETAADNDLAQSHNAAAERDQQVLFHFFTFCQEFPSSASISTPSPPVKRSCALSPKKNNVFPSAEIRTHGDDVPHSLVALRSEPLVEISAKLVG